MKNYDNYFTQKNTDGYTDVQIASLNYELAARMDSVDENDPNFLDIEKNTADQVETDLNY
jgi:hypothetical protein